MGESISKFNLAQRRDCNVTLELLTEVQSIKSYLLVWNPASIAAQLSLIPPLADGNFARWRDKVMLTLGCMDIAIAIQDDEPPKPIDTSSVKNKIVNKKKSVPKVQKGRNPKKPQQSVQSGEGDGEVRGGREDAGRGGRCGAGTDVRDGCGVADGGGFSNLFGSMGKATCQKVVLFLIVHSLIYVYGAAAAIGRKTLADLEIRRELKRLNKPAIKTIKSEDGDIIDCVDIYKQPAFDHPLLKNHTIQSAKLSLEKSNLGGEGQINAWNINVEGPSEATRSSIFVGRRDHFDLVTCGWMVSDGLFGDNATRLYAFWGTDDGGCFNLICSGFVQTGQAVTLGAATRVSTYGGEQIVIKVKIYWDNTTRSWWLAVENTLVGYWPGSLFKNMAGNADIIQWGGQVHNSLPRGRHTSTQMGSGHFPVEGFRKSAFFDKCVYFDTDTNIGKTPRDGYQKVVSKPTCYGISDIYPVEGGPGVGFFFGGPGGPSCDK
ncbi:hypothetical protein MRB53_005071 [Persea americana]|uniref:Uncharacterized protein n=1 Tax=Persea americana TaxID=3435 RepID=A0ACC2MD12_PERAE|nr:hypothetical protein MRB53_005071 [Persea americana]